MDQYEDQLNSVEEPDESRGKTLQEAYTGMVAVKLNTTLTLETMGSLKLPKTKLEFGRRSFAFQGALVYNTLPRHLRTVNSRFLFKSNLKQFFQ